MTTRPPSKSPNKARVGSSASAGVYSRSQSVVSNSPSRITRSLMRMTPHDIASMEGDVAKVTLAMVMATLQANGDTSDSEDVMSQNDFSSIVEVPTHPATPVSEFEDGIHDFVDVQQQREGLHSFFSTGGALAPELVCTPPSSPVAGTAKFPSTPAKVYQAAVTAAKVSRATVNPVKVSQAQTGHAIISQAAVASMTASHDTGTASNLPVGPGSSTTALPTAYMSVIQRIPFDGFPLPNYSGFHITEFYAVARGREVGIFPSWGETVEHIRYLSSASFKKHRTFVKAVEWLALAAFAQGGFLEKVTNA